MNDSSPSTADQDVLTQWVCLHGRAVRGYVLSMVGREDVADDLTQEVFRKAWAAHQRYREQDAARSYLICIADRLVIDRARTEGREINVEREEWERLDPADCETEPSHVVSQGETRQRLNEALDRISPAQRRVLLLRYYGDLSFVEIAAAIGCPLNTALSHARRGLLELRQILTEVS